MRAFFRIITKFFREADIFLLALSLISSIYGIILIASIVRNSDSGGSEVYVQLAAMIIGIVLFVIFSYVDIDIIADKYGFLLIFSALFISTLYFWGIGEEETGNRAWLRFMGIGIQPAEVVKVTFIIIIAKLIASYKERKTLNSFGTLLRIIVVFMLIFGLLIFMSSDVGSALIYGFIFVVMLYIGGVKLRWFVIGGGLIAAVFPLILNNFLSQGQRDRIRAPFQPDLIDPTRQGVLWQTDNSIKAIMSGGPTGQGLGKGRITQAGIIPGQRTDFIFSAAGEELGFIGCMLIIILLVLIIIRCIYVGVKSNNPLGLLVCTGIAAMLIAQTLENIGMCIGILPVIGVTLPLFSYGGSSMVASLAAMGIVSGIKMRPKPVRFRLV